MVGIMKEPIALVVPVLNRFDMFTEMMETVDTPVQLFVIDQWRNNRGVSWAWNEGMRRARSAGYKHAVIANDDLKFRPGSLRGIYDAIVDTGATLVSPNQQRHPARVGTYEDMGIRSGADFFCFAIDIEQTVSGAGWFDEQFFPAYFEDNDMHRRMRLAGLTSLIHTGHIVFHEGSMTQKFDKKNPNVDGAKFEAVRSYYDLKWGGTPEHESYNTPFNRPELTVRDWNGSAILDGVENSATQMLLESIDSTCYTAASRRIVDMGIKYEKF
jgi:hypothetical protein